MQLTEEKLHSSIGTCDVQLIWVLRHHSVHSGSIAEKFHIIRSLAVVPSFPPDLTWLDKFCQFIECTRLLWCNGTSTQLWRCQQILPFTRNAMKARYWANGTPSAVQSLVSVSMGSPLPSQWILGVGDQNHSCALQLFRKVWKWRTRRTFGDDWELSVNIMVFFSCLFSDWKSCFVLCCFLSVFLIASNFHVAI